MQFGVVLCLLLAVEPLNRDQVRRHVIDGLSRVPNHICTETLRRSEKRPGAHNYASMDRVRLDVGYIGEIERYSWPGNESLTVDDPRQLISGSVSNGDFAMLVHEVFTSPHAVFAEARENRDHGLVTRCYNFRVPIEGSTWSITAPGLDARVAYHGSFCIDKESLDLQQIDFVADGLPSSFGLKAVERGLRYARTHIGSADFLLPEGSFVVARGTAGDETRIEVRFDNCREYNVSSSIRFGEASAPEPRQSATAGRETVSDRLLPDRCTIEVILQTDVDFGISAVGDRVEGRVMRPVQLMDGSSIPEGAILYGMVSRLQVLDNERYLGFRFAYVAFGGRKLEITGREQSVWVQELNGHSRYEMGRPRWSPNGLRSPLDGWRGSKWPRGRRLYVIVGAPRED